ncbi:MAG TPA: hydrogenase maturation protease [Kineosporiaceae bacterium]
MPADQVDLLVIGIGSDLHRDDAAGRVVADRVEALGLAGVGVRSLCQLVPELVVDLARCARAVFVDADPGCTEVTVRRVDPADGGTTVTHHATPAGLLRLAGAVGVRPPDAVQLGIPATHLGLGVVLSRQTRSGVETAIEMITRLVAGT